MKRNDALHMHSHLSAFASASTTIVRVIGLLLAYEDTTGEMQEAINLFSPLWTSKTRFLPHTSLLGLANEAAVRTNRRYERAHSHYAEADKLSELVERVHTLTEFTRLPGANLDITLADAPFTSDVEWTQSLIIPVVNKTSPIVKHVGDLMAQHLLSKCQDVRAPCENRPGPPSGFYHASLYYNQTNTTLDRDGINREVGFDPLETRPFQHRHGAPPGRPWREPVRGLAQSERCLNPARHDLLLLREAEFCEKLGKGGEARGGGRRGWRRQIGLGDLGLRAVDRVLEIRRALGLAEDVPALRVRPCRICRHGPPTPLCGLRAYTDTGRRVRCSALPSVASIPDSVQGGGTFQGIIVAGCLGLGASHPPGTLATPGLPPPLGSHLSHEQPPVEDASLVCFRSIERARQNTATGCGGPPRSSSRDARHAAGGDARGGCGHRAAVGRRASEVNTR